MPVVVIAAFNMADSIVEVRGCQWGHWLERRCHMPIGRRAHGCAIGDVQKPPEWITFIAN